MSSTLPREKKAQMPPSSSAESQRLTCGESTANNGGHRVKMAKGTTVFVQDSAQSWVVCAAVLYILFGAATFGRALSITFLEFVQKFDASITTTSVCFTLHLLCISISSLLVMTLLVPVTGTRVSCLIGAVGNFICTICIGVAPNLAVFLFFMGLKGVCVGTTLVPAITMISQYFDKRRSLATALANCGLSVGAMGPPPIIEYLLEIYGVRGTYLLIAGLEMNAIAAAMLLRPLSRYKTVIGPRDKAKPFLEADEVDGADDEQKNKTLQDVAVAKNELYGEDSPAIDRDIVEDCNGALLAKTHPEYQQKDLVSLGIKPSRVEQSSSSGVSVSSANSLTSLASDHQEIVLLSASPEASPDLVPRMRSVSDVAHVARNHRQELHLRSIQELRNAYRPQVFVVSNPERCHYRMNGITGNLSTSYENTILEANVEQPNKQSGIRIFISKGGSLENSPQRRTSRESGSHSSVDTYSIVSHHLKKHPMSISHLPHHMNASPVKSIDGVSKSGRLTTCPRASTWSIVSAPLSDVTVDVEICALESHQQNLDAKDTKEDGDYLKDTKNVHKNQNCCFKTLVVLHSVFNMELLRTWALRCLILSTITGTLVQYILTYLPTIAVKQGLSPEEVSLLLTVGGAVDLASRIAAGAFTDLHILTPTQIVAIAQITIGTACHFTYYYTNFQLLMCLSVISGMFGGTRQNLGTLLSIQFMGADRFLKVVGFQSMFGPMSLALHHPLLSSILEATGSFTPPLHYVGVALYISSALLLLEPVAKRMDAARTNS